MIFDRRRLPVLMLALFALASPVSGKGAEEDEASEKKDEGLPLEPTRKVEFTTDEATWLSLDVSPDGETLALELLGDLYTLPFAGGRATRITSGLAFDTQPRFSPDGAWIAFLSDRDGAENLWIARADGSEPKQLSEDTKADFASPAWTPDGQTVIVSRSTWGLRTHELWSYHVRGGAGVQITKAKPTPDTRRTERHNAMGVAASPDERYLYYAQRRGGFEYNADLPLWQIARRDRITGDEDVLTQAPGSALRPLLSPDGTKLVYGTRLHNETGLRLRDLHSGEDRWLRYPVQRDDQEARFTRDLLPGYAFTPDGREVVVTAGGRIWRIAVSSGDATAIPFTADVALDLGPRLHFPQRVEQGPVRARLIQGPAQSPDGRRLAFSALTRLYVMDLPGGKPVRATSGEAREFQPAWSPDGAWLAYVTWSAEGGHLWKVRAGGGSRPVRLSDVPAFYTDPVWAPDGKRIVLLRGSAFERTQSEGDFGPPPGMDLIWIPAAGGAARLVVPARGVGRPHFTRDPERIYLYLSPGLFAAEGPNGLVSVRFDGSERREHLKLTGPGLYFAEEPVPATEIQASPDGRWALAHVANQLYVVALPRYGGEAPVVSLDKPSVPLEKLTEAGVDYFAWSADGETMTWAVGSTFFRRTLASVTFEKKKKEEDEEDAAADEDADGERPTEDAAPPPDRPDPAERTEVTVEVARSIPRGTVALRGARLVTMRGDEVIPEGTVVVRDGRVLAVGPSSQVAVPEGAQVFDVPGTTIVPGFIDTHAHWGEIRRGVLDVQNWSFLANLAYGVTAGLDVQTSTNDMFAYQDLVDAGEILGPRAHSTGPGIFSDNAFESLDQARGVLRKYKEHYRTRNLKSYIVGNRKQRQWVAQAAHELEMMPTTEGGLDLELDLTHAIDGFHGNEHSLPIVPLYRDVVELYARSRIAYTPTLLVAYGGPFGENAFYATEEVHDDPKLNHFTPHAVLDARTRKRPWFRRGDYHYPAVAAQAAKILRAGGLVGVGAHGQLQGLGYHWELWALQSGGMTPLEALRCATLHGAEILGFADDLGSLEPGKLADLVVLERNPLDDIRNTNSVRLVMKNGELLRGDTLDRLWPSEKKLPPLWFHDEASPTAAAGPAWP